MNHHLVYPIFALVLLTFSVALVMLKARVTAIARGQVGRRYFSLFEGTNLPEAMVKTSRQFVNLFEVPVLFYVACLVAMQLPAEDPKIHVLAWTFVGFRAAQALVHLTINHLYSRMASYFCGWLVLLMIWGLILTDMS